MKTRIKWAKEEDAVLPEEVKKSPENLTESSSLSSGPVTVVNTKNVQHKTVSVEEMTASELCTILILKLQAKKHCLENMIEGLETFLKYKEEL